MMGGSHSISATANLNPANNDHSQNSTINVHLHFGDNIHLGAEHSQPQRKSYIAYGLIGAAFVGGTLLFGGAPVYVAAAKLSLGMPAALIKAAAGKVAASKLALVAASA